MKISMKRKLERIAEIAIVGVLISILIITYQDHSFESNLSKVIEFILWIGIYVAQVKWLIPKLLKEKKLKYLMFSIIIIAVSIIIGILFKTVHLEEMNYRRYYGVSPMFDYILNFEWWRFSDTINGILVSVIVSSIYGFLRNIKLPDIRIFQKVIPIIFFTTDIKLSL